MSNAMSPSIMRGNAAYSQAIDYLNPYGGGGAFSMERANSQMLRALVLEQRTANLIALLSDDPEGILTAEDRAWAARRVRRTLGIEDPEDSEDPGD